MAGMSVQECPVRGLSGQFRCRFSADQGTGAGKALLIGEQATL